MINFFRDSKSARVHLAVWTAAAMVGIAAVLFARLIGLTQSIFFEWFHRQPYWVSGLSPFIFVAAAAMVRYFAPDAKGSGIPQVLAAIEASNQSKSDERVWISNLVSIRTAIIKIISSTLGILGGASIGREGPTVQISSSIYSMIGRKLKQTLPEIDTHSFLIAGAASGVAAAFNTPIAGITFAIEEIVEGAFGEFRQIVMLGVIIAGIMAQALAGDYLYFGHPAVAKASLILAPEVISISILGGLLGGGFAYLLSHPHLVPLPKKWWARAWLCGAICSLIGFYSHGDTAGSGYEITRRSLESITENNANPGFPILKISTTILSYFSGMAGGIFSPCLSIGAAIGLSVAKLTHFLNFKACALIGMVAFFSAVVQAPLTAVIIVMEMTDEHILILPFMITAFLAQAIGKKVMPVPLYKYLASIYFKPNR